MTSVRFIKQRGLAMVEFAIAAPVLLLFGFLAADFARAYALKNTLTKAVTSAARYVAKQPCTDTGAIDFARTNIYSDIVEAGWFTTANKPVARFYYISDADKDLCDFNTTVACTAAEYICVSSAPFDYPLLSPALYRWYGGSGLGAIPISAYSIQRLTP